MDRTRLDLLRSPLRSAWDAIQPPPRLVDWTLFSIVVFETISGLYSFTVADPSGRWLFWAHRIAGLTFVVFLAFKLARVRHRLTNPDRWLRSMVLSVLTATAAIGAIATGIVWVGGLDVRLSYWTLLSIHVAFGLLLVPLMIAHLTTRFRLPRREDLDRRRTTLQYSALFVGSAVTYRGQELANRLLGTPGEDRRFTGSQVREGEGNDAFPLTSWVADDPDPIDVEEWTLDVRGAVGSELSLGYDDLDSDAELEALLDCTSGWYTVQDWRGIRVGDLLDEVEPASGAEYVRFVSVTGYRWSLPIDEARDAMLATHVGGDRLSHGHGAPIRLVAPGRRGFQWVKWIVRVDVRKRGDPAQWLVTLISGFD